MESSIIQPLIPTITLPSSSLEFLIGKVTIGITTRNRWAELEETIDQLIRLGLQAIKVIVIDDGSTEAKAQEVCRGLKHCHIEREEYPLGLVVERNRIATLCDTEYLISLDDDACFLRIEGLVDAVRRCDEDPSIAVLAFLITMTGATEKDLAKQYQGCFYDTTQFIGCGHMLRVATFRQLGGYRGYLYYMCEEREFALRVYSCGQRVVLCANVWVHHRHAPGDRGSRVHAFYAARNTILIWLLYMPGLALTRRVARAILGHVYISVRRRQYFICTVAGILSGVTEFVLRKSDRTPMSIDTYNRWLAVRAVELSGVVK